MQFTPARWCPSVTEPLERLRNRLPPHNVGVSRVPKPRETPRGPLKRPSPAGAGHVAGSSSRPRRDGLGAAPPPAWPGRLRGRPARARHGTLSRGFPVYEIIDFLTFWYFRVGPEQAQDVVRPLDHPPRTSLGGMLLLAFSHRRPPRRPPMGLNFMERRSWLPRLLHPHPTRGWGMELLGLATPAGPLKGPASVF